MLLGSLALQKSVIMSSIIPWDNLHSSRGGEGAQEECKRAQNSWLKYINLREPAEAGTIYQPIDTLHFNVVPYQG